MVPYILYPEGDPDVGLRMMGRGVLSGDLLIRRVLFSKNLPVAVSSVFWLLHKSKNVKEVDKA